MCEGFSLIYLIMKQKICSVVSANYARKNTGEKAELYDQKLPSNFVSCMFQIEH